MTTHVVSTGMGLSPYETAGKLGHPSHPARDVASEVSLIDLDPVPITSVSGGPPLQGVNLLDILNPASACASPFVATGNQSRGTFDYDEVRTPRNRKVGTTGGNAYTPGGTKVPNGPPPSTPPRAVTFGPVVTAPLPPSPMSPPPAPPPTGGIGVPGVFYRNMATCRIQRTKQTRAPPAQPRGRGQ